MARPPQVRRAGNSGMSMAQILGYAPHEPDVRNARQVSIKRLNAGRLRDGQSSFFTSTTETNMPGEQPRLHSQTMKARDPAYRGPLSSCPNILVSCDCERHCFVWEYALWSHGAAEIIYCNGQPPLETNANLIPACCKHLIRVMVTMRREKR